MMTIPGFAREPASTKAPRRDVFLITIDTLRADHVHCYGYKAGQTPALDQLAKDGIRFTQAFTPSPITNTSHTTILTGLLPMAHGVTNFGVALNSSHPTLAELLRAQAYQTAAFIGAIVLDSKTLAPGLDRGFDFYDNFEPSPHPTTSRWGRVERRGKDVVLRAERWLDAHHTGPRLVWVHLYDPHDPYEPPPPYAQMYRDNPYDGEIAYADSALGGFVAYLKKKGWYDQALVIVVGDHGEGLGEHNEETHGIFLYDSTTHIPLIVKLPARQSGDKFVETQVSTTDILPTVLDVLRLPPPAHLDGVSLEPYFDGTSTAARPVFGETDYPLSFGWAPLRSVRDAGFKFIEAPRSELYDLGSDSKEQHSIYEPWNPALQKLREKLAAQREKYPKVVAAVSTAAVGSATTEELQALGYLGPADSSSSSTVSQPSLLPDPKDKIAEQNLLHAAMLAVDDARPEEARVSLEKVLQLNSKSFAALRQMGQLELNSGSYAEAASYFERASDIRPDDANVALKHGEALNMAGDMHGAEHALQASLKLNPDQYHARFLLGSVYFRLRDLRAAEDQLEAALLVQTSFEAEAKLAEVLLAQERFEEARQHLETAITFRRDSSEAYDLLARAFTGLGDKERAQQAENRSKSLLSRKIKK
jgi:choline-sulfatase